MIWWNGSLAQSKRAMRWKPELEHDPPALRQNAKVNWHVANIRCMALVKNALKNEFSERKFKAIGNRGFY